MIYFKLCQSQMPVIEKAIETAALMLGSDRSRGYCLEISVQTSWPEPTWITEIRRHLLFSMTRFFKFLPGEQWQHSWEH